MSTEDGQNPAFLQVIASELVEGLPNDGYNFIFNRVTLPKGWDIIKGDDDKIVLHSSERQLVAKAYAPSSENFAQQEYQAIMALSDLELPIPVLRPLGIFEGILFFELGSETDPKHVNSAGFTMDHIGLMEDTVRNFNLKPVLFRKLREALRFLDLVAINDKLYIIDPIDDTAAAVFDYAEHED